MSNVSELPPGARRMFGLKDVFTTLNVLSGVVAVYFCVIGHPLWGAYAFLAGYTADVFDGLVARLTRSSNRFGSEYDTAADFVAQAVAPAFVVMGHYRQSGPALGLSEQAAGLLGLGLAALLIVTASVRQARNMVRRVHVDFAWIGLPRNVASFILLGFVNSELFIKLPGGLWFGVVLVVYVAVAELTSWPYMSHHGRNQFWYAKLGLIAFLTTTPLALFFATRYVWDVVFMWTFGYAALSWLAMTREERVAIREAVRAANEKLVSEEVARAAAAEEARARTAARQPASTT